MKPYLFLIIIVLIPLLIGSRNVEVSKDKILIEDKTVLEQGTTGGESQIISIKKIDGLIEQNNLKISIALKEKTKLIKADKEIWRWESKFKPRIKQEYEYDENKTLLREYNITVYDNYIIGYNTEKKENIQFTHKIIEYADSDKRKISTDIMLFKDVTDPEICYDLENVETVDNHLNRSIARINNNQFFQYGDLISSNWNFSDFEFKNSTATFCFIQQGTFKAGTELIADPILSTITFNEWTNLVAVKFYDVDSATYYTRFSTTWTNNSILNINASVGDWIEFSLSSTYAGSNLRLNITNAVDAVGFTCTWRYPTYGGYLNFTSYLDNTNCLQNSGIVYFNFSGLDSFNDGDWWYGKIIMNITAITSINNAGNFSKPDAPLNGDWIIHIDGASVTFDDVWDTSNASQWNVVVRDNYNGDAFNLLSHLVLENNGNLTIVNSAVSHHLPTRLQSKYRPYLLINANSALIFGQKANGYGQNGGTWIIYTGADYYNWYHYGTLKMYGSTISQSSGTIIFTTSSTTQLIILDSLLGINRIDTTSTPCGNLNFSRVYIPNSERFYSPALCEWYNLKFGVVVGDGINKGIYYNLESFSNSINIFCNHAEKIWDRNPKWGWNNVPTSTIYCRDADPTGHYYKQFNVSFDVEDNQGNALQGTNCTYKAFNQYYGYKSESFITDSNGFNATWFNTVEINCSKASGAWASLSWNWTNFNFTCEKNNYQTWSKLNMNITEKTIFPVSLIPTNATCKPPASADWIIADNCVFISENYNITPYNFMVLSTGYANLTGGTNITTNGSIILNDRATIMDDGSRLGGY